LRHPTHPLFSSDVPIRPDYEKYVGRIQIMLAIGGECIPSQPVKSLRMAFLVGRLQSRRGSASVMVYFGENALSDQLEFVAPNAIIRNAMR
jgi:hypothetical protein